MRSGFSIGRLFGIRIYIDWSWILIFLLVTWNLAGGVFPRLHPEWSLALNLGISLLASLLFFASVLAHELAHSLMAIARGIPVRRITLFIFGGVSDIEREPPSPGTEFLIAVVGPLTSLALGALFLFLGRAGLTAAGIIQDPLGLLARLDPLSTLLLWLGPVNLILGIFNLIPGFPLDGGRVLRSILWAMTDNLRRATRWATLVGQLVAWLFILAGIAMAFGVRIPFLGTGLVSGLWLAFIGWFLNNAAAQSYQQVVVSDLLEGVRVSRLMRNAVPTVDPGLPVSALVYDQIIGGDDRSFPVVKDDQLVGLVCIEDVRKIPRSEWESTPVTQIMTPAEQLDIVAPQEDATAALQKLARRDVSQMPVVQNGRLVGILRRRDILRWLEVHSEAAA
jgi:Zn-dependent protease/predicted transcriptional regulator